MIHFYDQITNTQQTKVKIEFQVDDNSEIANRIEGKSYSN